MRAFTLLFLFLITTSFSPSETANVQKLRYRILKDGRQIGLINAHRIINGKQIIYEVETEMEIRIVFPQIIRYSSKAVYNNDVLQNSISRSYINDKLHQSCTTIWKGNHYDIIRDKHKEISNLNRQISYSGAMLYFREPANLQFVYSEMSGHDNYMHKLDDGKYMLTDYKSKRSNKYRYKGGILDFAAIDHVLFDFEVERIH